MGLGGGTALPASRASLTILGPWAEARSPPALAGDSDDSELPDACHGRARRGEQIATAKLSIEFNATKDDIGVHGAFDDDVFDRHGFSRSVYDVHVVPEVHALCVPAEFLEPNTAYELGVLALEASGNQTVIVGFFLTA